MHKVYSSSYSVNWTSEFLSLSDLGGAGDGRKRLLSAIDAQKPFLNIRFGNC